MRIHLLKTYPLLFKDYPEIMSSGEWLAEAPLKLRRLADPDGQARYSSK